MDNFWRFFDFLLVNCEIKQNLSWSKNCVISEISRTPKVSGDNPVEATLTTNATLQINNAKLFVPLVNLTINDKVKFLEK